MHTVVSELHLQSYVYDLEAKVSLLSTIKDTISFHVTLRTCHQILACIYGKSQTQRNLVITCPSVLLLSIFQFLSSWERRKIRRVSKQFSTIFECKLAQHLFHVNGRYRCSWEPSLEFEPTGMTYTNSRLIVGTQFYGKLGVYDTDGCLLQSSKEKMEVYHICANASLVCYFDGHHSLTFLDINRFQELRTIDLEEQPCYGLAMTENELFCATATDIVVYSTDGVRRRSWKTRKK